MKQTYARVVISLIAFLFIYCSNAIAQSTDSIVGTNGHCLPTTLSVVTNSGVPEIVQWKKGAIIQLKDTILWNHHGTTVAGDASAGGSGLSQLNNPRGIFVTANYDIYIADQSNHRIVKWTPPYTTGVIVAGSAIGTAAPNYTALNAPAADSLLNQPIDIFIDANGNIYVLDAGLAGQNYDQRVLVFPSNTIAGTMGTVIAGYGSGVTPTLKSPIAMKFNNSSVGGSALYIVDQGNHCVNKYPYSGSGTASNGVTIVNQSQTFGNAGNNLYNPTALFIDGAATPNLYVADGNNYRVLKYSMTGTVPTGGYAGSIVAGTGSVGPADATHLNIPSAVWVDCTGYTYVADNFYRVLRFPPGSVSGSTGVTIAGFSGGVSPATVNDSTLQTPSAIFMNDININGVMNDGTLYVCDRINSNRVHKFSPNSPLTLPLTNISGNANSLWNATVTYFGCSGTPTSVSPNFKTYLIPAAGSITIISSTNPSTCGGIPNGSITISGLSSGSTYYIKYTLNGSATPSSFPSFVASGTSYTITGLTAGTYTNMTIGLDPTFACAIPLLPNVTLSAPPPPSAPVLLGGNTYNTCSGTSLTLSVLVPVGAGITYYYTGTSGFSSPNPTTATTESTLALNAGSNNDTVYAILNGCQSAATPFTINVTQSPVISSHSHINPTSCTSNDGSIILNGLTANVVYSVTYNVVGTNITLSLSANSFGTVTIPNLGAGQYDSIRVTAGGCTSSPWISELLTAPSTPTFSLNASSPTSCGGTDGCININGLSNNSYYLLSSSPSLVNVNALSNTSSGTNGSYNACGGIPAGTYTIAVTLAGCSATHQVTVNPAPSPSFTISSHTNSNQCQVCNGTITLTTGAGSYDTLKYTNLTTITSTIVNPTVTSGNITITGLCEANYGNFTPLIAHNCSSTISGPVTLTGSTIPATPILTQSNLSVCSGNPATIHIIAPTGAGYSYQYSGSSSFASPNPTTDTFKVIQNPNTGLQHDTVFALLNGCVSAGTAFSINVSATPVISSHSHINPTTCTSSDGSITLGGLNAGDIFTVKYILNGNTVTLASMTVNASGNIILPNLAPGLYDSIRVIGTCSSTTYISETLTTPQSPVFNIASTDPTTCGSSNGCITLSGLTANTVYTVVSSPVSTGINSLSGTSTSASGTYTHCNGISAGTYTVTVVSGACSTSHQVVYHDPVAPVFTIAGSDPSTCGGSNGCITISGLNPNTIYTIASTPASTGISSLNGTSSGSSGTYIHCGGISASSYSVVVSILGCTTTHSVTLSNPVPPTFSIGNNIAPTLCNPCNGMIALATSGAGPYDSLNYTIGTFGITIINPVVVNDTIKINNLCAGVYNYFTLYAHNCSTTYPGLPIVFNTITPPTTPVISSNSPVCVGDVLHLSATSIAGVNYLWIGAGGFTSTLQSNSIANVQLFNTGGYNVTVTDTVTHCYSVASTNINVDTVITPYINIVVNNNPAIGGSQVTFTAYSNIANPGYQWILNGHAIFGAVNSTYTYLPSNGDVMACVLSTASLQGCFAYTQINSNSITMAVYDEGIGNINAKEAISIYPNPANNALHIDHVNEALNYTIQNLLGSTVVSGTLENRDNVLTLQDMAAGTYILELVNHEGLKQVVRLVKE